jgi:TatD DNase family protein
MIIDSHCHLDYEPLSLSLDAVVDRAKKEGVEYLLTISTKDNKYKNILNIINNFENVYGTYGIHPHEAKNHTEITNEIILQKIKKSKKIIGIGETGLDFYYNHSDKRDQINLFLEHIHSSQTSDLPIIIHTRSAENETFDILKKAIKEKEFKILIHCFTGSKDFAIKLLDIGSYFSASGVVTFKNSGDLANTFKVIPNERILVETDSPYLAPVPLRGKSNEPSNIIHTVKFLSKLKNLDYKDFSKITTDNFFHLFGKFNEK